MRWIWLLHNIIGILEQLEFHFKDFNFTTKIMLACIIWITKFKGLSISFHLKQAYSFSGVVSMGLPINFLGSSKKNGIQL